MFNNLNEWLLLMLYWRTIERKRLCKFQSVIIISINSIPNSIIPLSSILLNKKNKNKFNFLGQSNIFNRIKIIKYIHSWLGSNLKPNMFSLIILALVFVSAAVRKTNNFCFKIVNLLNQKLIIISDKLHDRNYLSSSNCFSWLTIFWLQNT